jgi:hypothetical protein
LNRLDTGFFLTGGTALGRGCYHHRYSDDLDFFVNASDTFDDQLNLVLARLREEGFLWDSESNTDFLRNKGFCTFKTWRGSEDVKLKLDFVNDIPAHFGGFTKTALFDKTDSIRNILSNKLSALFRFAAKDVADLREIALHERFSWPDIAAEAGQKDAGVDLPMFGEMLETIRPVDYAEIHWTEDIPWERFIADIKTMSRDMIFCADNSLAPAAASSTKPAPP